MSGAVIGSLLAWVILLGAADIAPVASASGRARTERLLMIKGAGDSVDFRLTDSSGRVAVVAVDSAVSAIPECEVEKSSWFSDHDDSDWDPDSLDLRPYGGGVFTLEDPQPGVWYLDALAASGCADSCDVEVVVWSMKHVVLDAHARLLPGEGVRWRLTLAPLARREGRTWVRLELERRANIAKLGSRRP